MSGTTSVPQIALTSTGWVAPTEAAIVVGLNADYTAAFGGNLNVAPGTPGGQLIASTSAILADANGQELALFNGVDPAYASGRMQDAIGRIYYLTRNPALPTVLQVACNGSLGVVIPVGALVADSSGNQYACTQAGTIGVSGTITLSFAAVNTGPTAVPATLAIYQAIPQWNAVSVVSGVVGNVVEGRAAFEARRAASVAQNAAGFPSAIAGAVANVPGVIDWYVYDNAANTSTVVGGVTIAANSIYVCVAGGASAAVAQAIWSKKNPGCSYTGNTTVTVYDTNSGYTPAYPSYSVTYQVPTSTPICVLVTLKNSAQVPSNVAAQVQAAMQAAFLGSDGGPRARIGSQLFASRFYAGVAALGAWAQIVSILIGTNGTPTASFTGAISGATMTVSGVTGTIAAGQFVYGVGVPSGTIIASGAGATWTLNQALTIGSEAMTAVAAGSTSVTMNINQIPTLANADINVVLV
jgi:hypothetical protein